MAKYTYQQIVDACSDLTDAIGELRGSFTFDPVDEKIGEVVASAVPDYLAESTSWMKDHSGKIRFDPEIEFKKPVEVINEAARNARSAIQNQEPRAAMKAFVAAAGACYHTS